MGKTSIEWTDFSTNPIRARLKSDPTCVGHYCEKVSPGCAHCYSSRFQPRFGLPEFKGASGAGLELVEPFLDPARLLEVVRRRQPTKYFWCDMTDLFGAWVPWEWVDQCFGAMLVSPQHTHQVLTKRPERMREYVHAADGREIRFEVPGRPMNREPFDWPAPNIQLGTSVEDQPRTSRIDELVATPARVRFLSCEPLLGPLDLAEWLPACCDRGEREGRSPCPVCVEHGRRNDPPAIHWVIAGGESGDGARPMHPDWARSLRDRCRAAGIPFFFKQWGAWLPLAADSPCLHWDTDSQDGSRHLVGARVDGADYGRNAVELDAEDDRVAYVRVGKKAAGRMLDGEEWNEFPGATA